MKRKFYKTVLKVEILVEDEPLEWSDLKDVAYAISQGDCSGIVKEVSTKRLSCKRAAEELIAQGSDPEFFQLDSSGNDLSE